MEHYPRRLLTIVTEALLERELLAEFEALGVRGYTITDARGKGGRGTRTRTGRRRATYASRSSARRRSPSASPRGCGSATTITTR